MSSKKLFIYLFLLVLSNTIYSQDIKKKLFYTDAFFVTSNENNFEYIKEIEDYETNKKNYTVKIYYKSGKIYLTGNTLDKDKVLLHGKCLYYYENGKKKRIANYENNKLIDKQYYYHENGLFKLESEIEVSKNKKESIIKILNFFDENNVQKVTNGEGEYVDQESDNETSFGVIKNFVKEGIWKGRIIDEKVEFTEQYNKGKLTSGNSIDSLNNKYSYNLIRETASPKKGMNDFYSYVKNCGVIPKNIDGYVTGKILVIFDVNEKGALENVSAYSQDQFGVTENALKLISKYENWIPGKYRGMLVKTHFTLPITFQ
jgi:antitoxin component YwqK of YwqJK toxin-antitoxin module